MSTPDRVLIVDDSQINRKLLSSILCKENYRLEEACDGQGALESISAAVPDLVLLDVMMPGLDGFEVLARLRGEFGTSNLPVIFLTALSEVQDKVRGLEAGASDYITKPFDRSEVLARVRTQLRINHLTQSLLAKQSRLDEDLSAAADIQKSLILGAHREVPGVRMTTRFQPCDSIGGDIFNTVRLDERHLALYMVDVSGHGVPSAMVTVSVAQSLSIQAGLVVRSEEGVETALTPPAQVLELLDAEYPMERFDKYFTMAYVLLDTYTGELLYSCAAHPPPLLVRTDGEIVELLEGGSVIGSGLGIPFDEGREVLRAGDRLYLYTDGVVEQMNRAGEQFGRDRLQRLLTSQQSSSLEEASDLLMLAVDDHKEGGPSQDDISFFALEYRPTVDFGSVLASEDRSQTAGLSSSVSKLSPS